MKPVLNWIKGHIVIVVCVLVILAVLPAGFVGANMWNTKIAAKQKEAFDGEKRKLDGASTVTYTLPAVLRTEQSVESRQAPNAVVTRFFAEQRERRAAQVQRVVEAALEMNQAQHQPLVDGLLPEPPSQREGRRLALQAAARVTGDLDERSVYAALLDEINAGMPPNPEQLTEALRDVDQSERDALQSTSGTGSNAVPDEELEALRDRLVAQRLGAYASRANELSVYASPDAIYFDGGAGYSRVPSQMPTDDPSLVEVFGWTFDYWVISDVLHAVDAANRDRFEQRTPIPESVVKRIDSVRVRQFAALASAASTGSSSSGTPSDFGNYPGAGARGGRDYGGRDFGNYAAPQATTTGGATGGGEASHTGRTTGQNGTWDIRVVELTGVFSSVRLPQFIEALGATNFMTVTGLSLEPVDPRIDLADGFYYGDEEVVRATLTIETVWLREWTKWLMPEAVRTALGITLPTPNATTDEQG